MTVHIQRLGLLSRPLDQWKEFSVEIGHSFCPFSSFFLQLDSSRSRATQFCDSTSSILVTKTFSFFVSFSATFLLHYARINIRKLLKFIHVHIVSFHPSIVVRSPRKRRKKHQQKCKFPVGNEHLPGIIIEHRHDCVFKVVEFSAPFAMKIFMVRNRATITWYANIERPWENTGEKFSSRDF